MTTTRASEKPFYDDPFGMFADDKYLEFWPTHNSTPASRLNSIVRLILYISVICFAIRQDPRYLLGGMAGVASLGVVHWLDSDDQQQQQQQSPATKQKNANDNVFGNRLPTDPEGMKPNPANIQKRTVNRGDDFQLDQMANDWNNRFYTMPNQGVLDFGKFGNYAYGNMANETPRIGYY